MLVNTALGQRCISKAPGNKILNASFISERYRQKYRIKRIQLCNLSRNCSPQRQSDSTASKWQVKSSSTVERSTKRELWRKFKEYGGKRGNGETRIRLPCDRYRRARLEKWGNMQPRGGRRDRSGEQTTMKGKRGMNGGAAGIWEMRGRVFYSRQSRHTGFLTSVAREYFRCHYRVILQWKRHWGGGRTRRKGRRRRGCKNRWQHFHPKATFEWKSLSLSPFETDHHT